MKNILDEIVATKKVEVEQLKTRYSIEDFEKSTFFSLPCKSMKSSILEQEKFGIIAELKRKSPSKGWINKDLDLKATAIEYQSAGAAGISILTDEVYFGGNSKYISDVKSVTTLPCLRKDFIVDEFQLFEAKAIGADIILLIAACLNINNCNTLCKQAKKLGLEVLLEIHNEKELDYINTNVDIVGVNNRNLKTFKTSIENSIDLANKIPADFVKISESGIDSIEKTKRLVACGYKGFLIGEHFMKTANIATAFKKLHNEN